MQSTFITSGHNFTRLMLWPWYGGRFLGYCFWLSVIFVSALSTVLVVFVAVVRYLYVFRVSCINYRTEYLGSDY